MERLFERHPDGLGVDDFVTVTKTLCGFPSFFNAVLYKRIYARGQMKSLAETQGENKEPATAEGQDGSSVGADELPADARIPLSLFAEFWKDEIETYDYIDRFFRLVKKPNNSSIEKVMCSQDQQMDSGVNMSLGLSFPSRSRGLVMQYVHLSPYVV